MTGKCLYDPKERFWHYVNIKSLNECWEWTGSITPNGYGRYTIHHNVRTVSAHKFSWEIHYGDVPDGLVVRHTCDNKKCVNPNHLLLGTQADNIRDRDERGLTAKWERHWKSKLNRKDVEKIRRLYRSGKYSQSQLGKMFGVYQTTVSRVVLEQTWSGMDAERIINNTGMVEQ